MAFTPPKNPATPSTSNMSFTSDIKSSSADSMGMQTSSALHTKPGGRAAAAVLFSIIFGAVVVVVVV
eukprot:CAMPEP_0201639228 /NCGR_PEP_ID=MMETSP0493-20130528/18745_1 /ASSEMBLY_ACC=CAM_ASM_000838 /TAXON_ID=420259 /ORGANISM="Thalassiosira gravida, Strain GMp14c1" /LENGTH=66 /DNA_ID=CAMNT_0048112549 /DNA_START=46 /DNA_END=243 /DNA_ORIENTATION=+